MVVLVAILVIFLLLIGLVGCILPILPGQWIAYAALWVVRLAGLPMDSRYLIVGGIATLVVTILDNIVPAWGAKKCRCSRRGVWWCFFGSIAGVFFLPWGVVIGPFLGAFLGELSLGRDGNAALISGMGALIGFLFGIGLKMALCGLFAYWCIQALFK